MLGKSEIAIRLRPKNVVVMADQPEGDLVRTALFSSFKHLIELHWFRNFPLWHCLTGSGRSIESSSDDQRAIANCMYSLRQTVALFHIDRPTWRSLSITLLHLQSIMEDEERPESFWDQKSNVELVEAAIESMVASLRCRVGHNKKVGLILKHAIIHVENLHRKKVDAALRQRLGNGYGEWERLPEDQSIPQDVVL